MSPSTATVRRSKRPSRRRPDGRVPLVRRLRRTIGHGTVFQSKVCTCGLLSLPARPASQLATRVV
eukprot:scaffold3220_cov49-Phaeocystis_antarctica.AAC.1